ncbi:MAG: MOSC domain-containing protein [Candidatus Binatia bacterium]
MNTPGFVISLHIAPTGAATMQSQPQLQAVVGRGLEGDRYFLELGTYSRHTGTGRHATLIEMEAIEALKRDYDIDLPAALSRRNIVTRGVALNHLVGREVRIGQAVLRGTRLCDPCAHLEKLSWPGTMRGLIHRGGLRVEIVCGGMIRVGDAVTPMDD